MREREKGGRRGKKAFTLIGGKKREKTSLQCSPFRPRGEGRWPTTISWKTTRPVRKKKSCAREKESSYHALEGGRRKESEQLKGIQVHYSHLSRHRRKKKGTNLFSLREKRVTPLRKKKIAALPPLRIAGEKGEINNNTGIMKREGSTVPFKRRD